MKRIAFVLVSLLLVFTSLNVGATGCVRQWEWQQPCEEEEECDVLGESTTAIFADGSELVRYREISECNGEVVSCSRAYYCPGGSGGGMSTTNAGCQARNAYNANTALPCPRGN